METAIVTHETFADLVHEEFALSGSDVSATPDASARLTLVSLELKPQRMADARQPFVLTFDGPSGAPLPQSVYRLEHPATGPLDVFIVPVEGDAERVVYEAVFN